MYFTEQPMSAYPAEEGRKFGYTALIFPNKYFDSVAGSQLYEDRIVEYQLAEESGYDGIMLKCNIMASILAAVTKRVKIVLLGNPLPIADNPVRLAEELAMIDMISKGRLVSGFVRGGGVESLATNTNPAYNRERFEEAHDLIIKTWTTPGPWRWEGRHYQLRVVNPWVLPLQKPHPRIWIPGVSSRETIIWAAQHRYPYIALNTSIEDSNKIWAVYDRGGRKGRLQGRAGAARLPDPVPRAGERGEGLGERAAVHVDARRVHRTAASGVGGAVRISRTVGAAGVGRGSRRAAAESGGGSAFREADRADADRRRHAGAGGAEAPRDHGGDAAVDYGVVGQRRERYA